MQQTRLKRLNNLKLQTSSRYFYSIQNLLHISVNLISVFDIFYLGEYFNSYIISLIGHFNEPTTDRTQSHFLFEMFQRHNLSYLYCIMYVYQVVYN